MKTYTVKYKEYETDEPKEMVVLASNKAEAYDKAIYDKLNGAVYSAWVDGYTFLTHGGYKYHKFNTHEGKRF